MPPLTRRSFLAGSAILAASPAIAGTPARGDPRLIVIGGPETDLSAGNELRAGWLGRLAAAAPAGSAWPGRIVVVGSCVPPSLAGGAPVPLCCLESLRLLEPGRLAGLLAPGRSGAVRVVAAPQPTTGAAGWGPTMAALGRFLAEPAGPRVAALAPAGAFRRSLGDPRERAALLRHLEAGLGAASPQAMVLVLSPGASAAFALAAADGRTGLPDGTLAAGGGSDAQALAKILARHLRLDLAAARTALIGHHSPQAA